MSKKFYPPVGFYFKVYIENFKQEGIDNAFQEVSGISMSLETKPLVEGGVNFMSRKLPGRTTYTDLVLKRGVIPKDSKLAKWCFAIFGSAGNGTVDTKVVTVQLTNSQMKPMMTWTFHDAYPIKWDVSSFNAEKNDLVIENITLTYTHFEVVGETNPTEIDAQEDSSFNLFD